MERPVRVRFAPSPTGALHIGGVRTALYNYLLARNQGGTMILRIEDTDQTRFVEGAEDYIREALEWCGIELDESPWKGGKHAPYRQSERKEMYKEYAFRLIEEGKAYYAFDTEEELDAMRERLKAARVVAPQYNAITRTQMKNSLTLPSDQVQELLDKGTPYVIRLKVPHKEDIRFQDLIRGWVVVHSSTIDDKVLMKSDGMPTYHLANVVDDHLMEISHVIRGEEWLPSAPLHVLLYRAFGWEDTMPHFAHLPLLLKPSGEGKLSKRDGDQFGFSVFPIEWKDKEGKLLATGYREDGYFSEAFINFLAFLGWNPGQGIDQEIFSMQELIDIFSIGRVGKSGTKFDIAKAKWFNQQYLRLKTDQELAVYLQKDLQAKGIVCENEKAEKICAMLKDRITFTKELASESSYFFEVPTVYDEKVISKKWNADAQKGLEVFLNAVQNFDTDFSAENAKHLLHESLEKAGIGMGKVMQVLRVVLTGQGSGPELADVMEWLGKNEVANRIEIALKKLAVNA